MLQEILDAIKLAGQK